MRNNLSAKIDPASVKFYLILNTKNVKIATLYFPVYPS
ncbi:hypothetical protein ENHAE0001_1830 [Enhydrobacter aerosaccus SK60]|nr:hypothetical protein ENHAE0001_1830 [Enhydrobacter aerosaccus SK60]